MIELSISEIQLNPGKAFKHLAFIATKHGRPIAMVVPLNYDPYGFDRYDAEDNLKSILMIGIDNLKEHPERVTPKILMDSIKALGEIQKKGEVASIINSATEETFGGKEEPESGATVEPEPGPAGERPVEGEPDKPVPVLKDLYHH